MNKLLVIPSIIFFVLGIIGLILPVIPQIPFFIISMLFLASASEKFRRYIITNKVYIKYIKKYIDKNEKLSAIIYADNKKHI